MSIIQAFRITCKAYVYSDVTCGMIDAVQDRRLATKYFEDLKVIPAHIMFYKGVMIPMTQEDLDPLMREPGNSRVMREHVETMKKRLKENKKEIIYQHRFNPIQLGVEPCQKSVAVPRSRLSSKRRFSC